ncbi:unnamed protein product [Scytosiphon promiscuus]
MDGKFPAAAGSRLKPAASKLVKAEQSGCSNSGNNRPDLGVRIDEALRAERAEQECSGGDQRGLNDDHVYTDPALVKWRIFEAVAKTNGQRAFANYWSALRDFMRGHLPRNGLDEALEASLGPDNVHLHNELIMCLLNNARCRYLPADLVSQVPASIRGKVVVVQAEAGPALPTLTAKASPAAPRTTSNAPSAAAAAAATALSGGNAVASPFQGKRTEGLLQNAGECAAAANGRIDVGDGSARSNGGDGVAAADGEGLGRAREKTEVTRSEFTSMSSLKIEGGSGGSNSKGGQPSPRSIAVKLEAAGVTAAKPSEGGPTLPAGDSRRDDDRIRQVTTATAGAEQRGNLSSGKEEEELWREAQLLEDEIASHFGPGSDLWQPWSGGEAVAGTDGVQAQAANLPRMHQQEQQQLLQKKESGSSRKRPAAPDKGAASTGTCLESERSPKALKREEGAAAPAVDSAANGAWCSPGRAPVARPQALEMAAADDLSPSHQSQRVPAARTLAPFLQALTASQQMKVSHDVCRVMTAGVKEYLRRVIEACLVKARDEQRRGTGTSAAAAAAAAASPSTAMNGSAGGGGDNTPPQTPAAAKAAAAPAASTGAGGGQRGRGGGVLTPGHLQSALETTPRLVGPPSSARAQWRKVATYAGEHQHQCQHHGQCQPPATAGAVGSGRSGPRL